MHICFDDQVEGPSLRLVHLLAETGEGLTLDDISSVPFREQWFHGGLQTFEELEKI